jgi:hypothetical protein
MRANEIITEKWSAKYKRSINCSHPRGFSQRAHCAGKNKHTESIEMEMVCEDCGMCQTHGSVMEIRKGQKDANGYTRCWPGKHAEGTKTGKNGGQVRNCEPNESQGMAEGASSIEQKIIKLYKQGLSDDEIASRLKIDSDDVKSVLDDYEWVTDTTGELKGVAEGLTEEFDLIESIIEGIAAHNGVDAEAVWEDLESLTEDELYAFAVTSQLNEDWQKANKQDRTAGMSQKAVNAYRRENPGSKLKTAVTTKPSKLKRGSKASKRRKSYCSRSRGQMKMHNISCAKTPDKAICKARRRWNC